MGMNDGEIYKPDDDSSALRTEPILKDGKLVGSRRYYENGQLEGEMFFDEKMKPSGVCKSYYKNGKLKFEPNFKNGEFDGLVKSYYENGQLEGEQVYKDGKGDGVGKFYRQDGTIRSEQVWKDGQLVEEKAYDGNGKLKP